MGKRKYYNYRKYSRNEEDLFESFIKPAIGIIVIAGLLGQVYKKNIDEFLNKYLPTIKFYFYLVVGIIICILILLLVSFIYRKFFKKEEIIDNEELHKILTEIKSFEQLRNHNSEVEYHMEIAGFLKRTFPELKIEQTTGNTRPDIVIENVAIEIKGPTTSSGLQTIADKIIRYLKHYEYIIVILFNVEVGREDFLEWKTDIIENFSHKGNRIYIIDK